MAEHVDRLNTIPWSYGAPLPHLVANGHTTYVVCYPKVDDPSWDGTTVTVRSPADSAEVQMLVVALEGCFETRLGGPNDEALNGHHLYPLGLDSYGVYEVHNSSWIEEAIAVNSVHPHHSDAPFRALHHYVLVFQDEMVEALATSITVDERLGTMRSVLTNLIDQFTS